MATKEEIQQLFEKELPNSIIKIESIEDRKAVIRRRPTTADLLPGGTVSGPIQ